MIEEDVEALCSQYHGRAVRAESAYDSIVRKLITVLYDDPSGRVKITGGGTDDLRVKQRRDRLTFFDKHFPLGVRIGFLICVSLWFLLILRYLAKLGDAYDEVRVHLIARLAGGSGSFRQEQDYQDADLESSDGESVALGASSLRRFLEYWESPDTMRKHCWCLIGYPINSRFVSKY